MFAKMPDIILAKGEIMTVINGLPNGYANILNELEDMYSLELMTEAITLPCGHSYNERTIEQLQECLSCKLPIDHSNRYPPNYTIRNLAIAMEPLDNVNAKAQQLFNDQVPPSAPSYEFRFIRNKLKLTRAPKDVDHLLVTSKMLGILRSVSAERGQYSARLIAPTTSKDSYTLVLTQSSSSWKIVLSNDIVQEITTRVGKAILKDLKDCDKDLARVRQMESMKLANDVKLQPLSLDEIWSQQSEISARKEELKAELTKRVKILDDNERRFSKEHGNLLYYKNTGVMPGTPFSLGLYL
jgi:hypothetical protein